MELLSLDSTTPTLEPKKVIEGYKSFIWNERYRDPGEFQITTEKNIQQTMTDLPLNTLVGVDDGTEVMIVENHEIRTDESTKKETLTVSGRSFEVFYEGRTTLQLGGEKMNDDGDPTAQIYAGPITSAEVAARIARGAMSLPGNFPADDWSFPYTSSFSTPTAIPSVVWRVVNRSIAYDEILRWLDEDNLGIRNFRPKVDNIYNGLEVNVYNGRNRTATVILDWKAGHFDSINYLWSIKGWKTAVHAATKLNYVRTANPGYASATGLNAKVGLLELSDVTQTGATGNAILASRGKSYLAQNKRTTILDCSVAANIPYVYNKDYFLGDTVKVIGKYNVNLNMMVTEYLRTKDEAGNVTSYPALSMPPT